MEIYIVFGEDMRNDDKNILGIFSNYVKAREYADDYEKLYGVRCLIRHWEVI